MLQLEEAIAMLTSAISPINQAEEIPLPYGSGRVLAEDIDALMDQPPFPRSPLDGYALNSRDSKGASGNNPVTLKVVGKIYAGQEFPGKIGKNECLRLMTGAPIPEGADTVIRQENTDYGEEYVQIYEELSPWQNYCPAGDDYHKGDLLIEKGTILSGMKIGVIAGTGRERVKVVREPVITVISTGDEVVAPGQALFPGKIYDSNRYLVTGRLHDLGLGRVFCEHCADNAKKMGLKIMEAAKTSDLIITTGGVSVGEKDIMHQVVEDLQATKLFWKVDLKPGAPTLAFMLGDRPVISLTGNPYGVAANFEVLVRPVLAELTGNRKLKSQKRYAILENDCPKQGGVRRFFRSFYEGDRVKILEGSQSSGTLATLAHANCLVEIPEEGGVKEGDRVWIHPFASCEDL